MDATREIMKFYR